MQHHYPADYYPLISPLTAGLRQKCPRCGEGALFKGFLGIQPQCPVCGLDYSAVDSGDGPAFFVMFFVGAVVTSFALITEILYEPPYWLHAALWLPLTVAVSAVLLRPTKAFLIAQQYQHRAAEGILESDGAPSSEND